MADKGNTMERRLPRRILEAGTAVLTALTFSGLKPAQSKTLENTNTPDNNITSTFSPLNTLNSEADKVTATPLELNPVSEDQRFIVGSGLYAAINKTINKNSNLIGDVIMRDFMHNRDHLYTMEGETSDGYKIIGLQPKDGTFVAIKIPNQSGFTYDVRPAEENDKQVVALVSKKRGDQETPIGVFTKIQINGENKTVKITSPEGPLAIDPENPQFQTIDTSNLSNNTNNQKLVTGVSIDTGSDPEGNQITSRGDLLSQASVDKILSGLQTDKLPETGLNFSISTQKDLDLLISSISDSDPNKSDFQKKAQDFFTNIVLQSVEKTGKNNLLVLDITLLRNLSGSGAIGIVSARFLEDIVIGDDDFQPGSIYTQDFSLSTTPGLTGNELVWDFLGNNRKFVLDALKHNNKEDLASILPSDNAALVLLETYKDKNGIVWISQIKVHGETKDLQIRFDLPSEVQIPPTQVPQEGLKASATQMPNPQQLSAKFGAGNGETGSNSNSANLVNVEAPSADAPAFFTFIDADNHSISQKIDHWATDPIGRILAIDSEGQPIGESKQNTEMGGDYFKQLKAGVSPLEIKTKNYYKQVIKIDGLEVYMSNEMSTKNNVVDYNDMFLKDNPKKMPIINKISDYRIHTQGNGVTIVPDFYTAKVKKEFSVLPAAYLGIYPKSGADVLTALKRALVHSASKGSISYKDADQAIANGYIIALPNDQKWKIGDIRIYVNSLYPPDYINSLGNAQTVGPMTPRINMTSNGVLEITGFNASDDLNWILSDTFNLVGSNNNMGSSYEKSSVTGLTTINQSSDEIDKIMTSPAAPPVSGKNIASEWMVPFEAFTNSTWEVIK